MIKKIFIALIPVLLLSLLFGSTLALAGTAYGTTVSKAALGYSYKSRNSVITQDFFAHGYNEVWATNKTVPTGYMGAAAQLCDANGKIKVTATMGYNESPYSANRTKLSAAVLNSANKGSSYFCNGYSVIWNGSTYVSCSTPRSPNQTL